jgi:hypothetical protein
MHLGQEEAQSARGAPEAAELQRQGKMRTAKHHKMLPKTKALGSAVASAAIPSWLAKMLYAAGK